jgi:hypothetical protein
MPGGSSHHKSPGCLLTTPIAANVQRSRVGLVEYHRNQKAMTIQQNTSVVSVITIVQRSLQLQSSDQNAEWLSECGVASSASNSLVVRETVTPLSSAS